MRSLIERQVKSSKTSGLAGAYSLPEMITVLHNTLMVSLRNGPASAVEWNDLTASWPSLTLTQTWGYGTARASDPWTVERVILVNHDMIVGAAQAMIRRLPLNLGGLCWISRGPIFDPNLVPNWEAYMQMLAALRGHYVADRGFYLRVAPAWPYVENLGRTTKGTGFDSAGPLGWHSAKLDLSQSEDTLRKALQGKWRNPVNKAEKSGMETEVGIGGRMLDAFCTAHDRFVASNGFATSVSGELLQSMHQVNDPGLELTTFRASLNGETAAWVLTARTGQRVEYLAGHSTPAGRRAGGGQFLLWQAILAAKTAGAGIFDVGGMDPQLTPPGIFAFKQGTGAKPYALAPELEALPRGPIRKIAALGTRIVANRARANE